MGEYEDTIQRLREADLDDEADVFEKYSKNQLREKAAKADAMEKKATELEEENTRLKAAPKREAALRAAKVDLSSLSPAEMEIIQSQNNGEYDEEWAKGLVEKYRLPVMAGGGEEEEEAPAAAGFGNPGGPSGEAGQGTVGKTTIRPEQAGQWGPRTRMRFREWCAANGKEDVFERLLMGETVTGVTFDPGKGTE